MDSALPKAKQFSVERFYCELPSPSLLFIMRGFTINDDGNGNVKNNRAARAARTLVYFIDVVCQTTVDVKFLQ